MFEGIGGEGLWGPTKGLGLGMGCIWGLGACPRIFFLNLAKY